MSVELSDKIRLIEGRGGLPELVLQYGQAQLVVCMQGAQVTSYCPTPDAEVLWLSDSACFSSGESIRGGIPVCWPWFGAHWSLSEALQPESQPEKPQHGYARTSNFQLVFASNSDEDTRVILRLEMPELDEANMKDQLLLAVEIRLSDKLWVEVRTTNLGDNAVEVGAALHSYFQVSDVSAIEIPELTGLSYRDKTRGFDQFQQSEPLKIEAEVDRVYSNPPNAVELRDPVLSRSLEIQSWGNTDLVVWNPWAEVAQAMADFDDQGYQSMVCIEPANALENRVLLAPGKEHRLGKSIRSVPA